ncbi:MAG: EF-hand domain-containing protein [Nibricoccus sp.]
MSSISSVSSSMPQRPDPAEFFKKADTDGSGGISKTELAEMLKNAPKPPGADEAQALDVDDIFSEVDTDGDGEISEAENKTHMEQMAKNGPGKPESMAGSSQAFDQFVEALKSSNLSDDDLSTLLKDWVSQLKEKGSSTTLFSTQA